MFEISRRDLVLGATGAYAACGLDKPVAFVGAANAQQPVAQSFRKYKVGDIEVFTLIDGAREVPLRDGMIKNATVEQIKAALRAAGLPDTHSRLMFSAWAVKSGDRLALIDSGTGGHPIYGQGNERLSQSMVAADSTPTASNEPGGRIDGLRTDAQWACSAHSGHDGDVEERQAVRG
jgi:hypothetical protein